MRRIGLVAGAAVAAVVLVTGCGDTGGDTAGSGSSSAPAGDAKAAEQPDAAKDARITGKGFRDHDVWGEDAYVTEYEITNRGEGAANYFVQLEFLDADGDVLGSTGVTADKLGEGKTNKGDTAPVDAEITNGKMSDIRDVRVSMVERTAPE
ncbi:hypothetical protein ACOZDE_18965 [Streptomyces griseoincarnatus]